MFFGKYLLDKKIINIDQLLEALFVQYESAPSLIRTIKENDFLSDDNLLSLIDRSITSGQSVLHIVKEDQLLNDNQLENMLEQQRNKGQGLGQILLKAGHLTVTEFDEYIKDYLSSKPKDLVENKKVKKDDKPVEVGISAAALATLKELGIADPEVMDELNSKVQGSSDKAEEHVEKIKSRKDEGTLGFNMSGEYLAVFDQHFYEKNCESVRALARGFNEKEVEAVFYDLRLVLGAAKIANLTLTVKLLQCWERAAGLIVENEIDFAKSSFLGFVKGFKQAIAMAWELRNIIESQKEETELLKKEEWKNKYLANIKEGMIFSQVKG